MYVYDPNNTITYIMITKMCLSESSYVWYNHSLTHIVGTSRLHTIVPLLLRKGAALLHKSPNYGWPMI